MKTAVLSLTVAIGTTVMASAQRPAYYPQTKVVVSVDSRIDTAFNYIVPVKLEHIFKGYKNLPAIVRTDEATRWITPGLSRTVYFEDGTTAKETLLTVVPHTSFSYEIENFTSSLRFLAKRVEGNWLFTDAGNGRVSIEWTYTTVPKNVMARGIINWVVLGNINGLLTNALQILKNDLEQAKSKGFSQP